MTQDEAIASIGSYNYGWHDSDVAGANAMESLPPAGDEAEARAWVARYDSLGFRQIKLYNLVHPDLVPAIAEETHRRGMRLSGHVPRGLTTAAAVNAPAVCASM